MHGTSKVVLILSAIILLRIPATAQDQHKQPHVLVTVVIDRSGSMAGEDRLATAKQEILAKARQLPPSPTSPWLVIPFNSHVTDPRRFANGVDELAAYIDSLTAEGGTDISSALQYAREHFSQAGQIPHLLCLLYSDGEDPHPMKVEQVSQEIDHLFAQRVDEGLTQSLIVRRWSSANADLVERLKSGHVDVIDAGEAELAHITFEPMIHLIDCDWDPAPTLRMTLEATITIAGHPNPADAAPLQITCVTPGIQLAPVEILPGGAAVPFSLDVVLDPTSLPPTLDLAFEVSSPQPSTPTTTGLLIATLARDHITLSVTIPPLMRQLTLQAVITQSAPSRWKDPLSWSWEIPLQVTVTVDDVLGSFPLRETIAIAIASDHNMKLSGPTLIEIGSPGTYTSEIAGRVTAEQAITLPLTIAAIAPLPPDLMVDPHPLPLELRAEPPGPISAKITASLQKDGPALWFDLRSRTILQQTTLAIQVDPPLRVDTALRTVPTTAITDWHLSGNSLNAGQPLQLSVLAQPHGGQLLAAFDIHVDPAQQGAVLVESPASVSFTIAEPPPAQLALAGFDQPIELLFREGGEALSLPVTPVLLGIADPRAAAGMQVQFEVAKPLQSAPLMLPLHQSTTVQLSPSPHALGEYFFQDACISATIHARAVPRSAPVQQASLKVFIRREAPAKRYLAVSLMVALAFLLIYLPWRFIIRLNDPSLIAEDHR